MSREYDLIGKLMRYVLVFVVGFSSSVQKSIAQDSLRYETPKYLVAPQREMSPLANFSEGLARFGADHNSFGYINTKGEKVIAAQFYDAGDFHQGRAWVAKRDTVSNKTYYGFIDRSGNLQIDYSYEAVGDFASGRAPVKMNGVWKYIDKSGEVIFQPLQNQKQAFHNGLLLQQRNGKYGYLDKEGVVRISFVYEQASDFADGLAVVIK